jgi:hypothetical protein
LFGQGIDSMALSMVNYHLHSVTYKNRKTTVSDTASGNLNMAGIHLSAPEHGAAKVLRYMRPGQNTTVVGSRACKLRSENSTEACRGRPCMSHGGRPSRGCHKIGQCSRKPGFSFFFFRFPSPMVYGKHTHISPPWESRVRLPWPWCVLPAVLGARAHTHTHKHTALARGKNKNEKQEGHSAAASDHHYWRSRATVCAREKPSSQGMSTKPASSDNRPCQECGESGRLGLASGHGTDTTRHTRLSHKRQNSKSTDGQKNGGCGRAWYSCSNSGSSM